jgi:DNA-binding PadR family transcriptional regulator
VNNDFLSLIEESKALNSSVFSLIRLLLLTSLASVGQEWVTYRELKAAFQVSDGALYTNINVLKKMGYVESKTIALEGKKLESYRVTKEGLSELDRVKNWLKKLLECGREKE